MSGEHDFDLPPPDTHGLDQLRTQLSQNREATRTAVLAKGKADDAARHATEVGERVRVLEYRSEATDQKLDRIDQKVDGMSEKLGRLLERSPWERAVYLGLALAALAYFALAIGDRITGAT